MVENETKDELIVEEVSEDIDYMSLGKALKRCRIEAGMIQEEAAKYFGVSRTVYTKYESGKAKPNLENLRKFADKFNVSYDELLKKISIAIPDTCALLKNKRLLHMLLEDYDKVYIPTTVMRELSYRKTKKSNGHERRTSRAAWQILANIDHYATNYEDRFIKYNNEKCKIPDSVPNKRNMINDHKVMAMAKELEKKAVGDVVIIHDDVDFTVYEGKAIKIDDYIAKRESSLDYNAVMDLNEEFDHLEYFQRSMEKIDLDVYLPDGMTLLISTIKCNMPEYVKKRDDRMIPPQKVIKKVKFLLDNGANPDKNDNGRYCLPPLAHCIQIRDPYGFDLFKILLEYGCDYNKASRDEKTASYMKVGKLNEGNTPLMIACFHGKRKFVKLLLEKEDLSINQQDSNGYTALMKCAVQRYNQKKKGNNKTNIYEEIYNLLIERGADKLIRDRNNHTADDWMKRGDDPSYLEDEIW